MRLIYTRPDLLTIKPEKPSREIGWQEEAELDNIHRAKRRKKNKMARTSRQRNRK